MTPEIFDRLRQENIANGKCPDCGGAGIVADMAKINRTGDPHANRTCRTCNGTGKPDTVLEAMGHEANCNVWVETPTSYHLDSSRKCTCVKAD